MQNTNMSEHEQHNVTIRRAPRAGMFISTGAAFGFVIAVIVTLLYPADPTVGIWATVGYMSLYGLGGGAVVGAVAFLIIDSSGVVGSGVAESAAADGGATGADGGSAAV
ncbi:MAG: hypothetical protein RIS25_1188 [Actinomycetota bacterium]